jgi:SAM-dependent methyltransferase
MKLNIGAGDTRYEGFLNLDYDERCKPDFCLNMEKDVWPIEDNSVDEVIAHHVLEHLGEGYFHVMQELYRVCQHGAIISVVVPHHRHEYFANDPTHRRPITPDGLWLFSKKYNDTCIEQGAAASRLAHYFKVDFEVVDVLNVPDDRYIKLFEGKTVDEVERYMHEHNNIIMEVRIKLTVIKEYAS